MRKNVYVCHALKGNFGTVTSGCSMNNLNDPPRWNIAPEPRGGAADGGKWNYALLVPMLGLAAFRWIWSRESQRQIYAVKMRHDQDVAAVTRDMELKYRDALRETQRSAAQLELALEKERQRVQGYRQALAAQSQQLVEERKHLQSQQQELEQEKARQVDTGVAAQVLRQALAQEEERSRRAQAALGDLEELLVERQGAFCNLLRPREHRHEMEKDLLLRVAKQPELRELGELETDLRDIFKNDKHCGDRLNLRDKRKNGSLMWLYLRYWHLQVTLQKHQRAETALRAATDGTQPK
ncbi:coiled-coil domain-containing protein 127a isoform X2 [Engraulis encrasicolus]|uniref:coiled-coil domain-containing protein 127a isoform X2 n=1 Tax=Engraulis encrasicolus TaxID=184585 RepID=UPI002FCEB34B